jgi:hypothetical protein
MKNEDGRPGRRAVLGGVATLMITFAREPDAHAVPPPPPGYTPPPPGKLFVDNRVSQNHGHAFAITIAEIDAAADKTYDISGKSGHKHEVVVTRANFLELQQSKIVRLASTSAGGHLHRIYAKVRVDPLPPDEVTALEIFIGGKDDHELVIPQSHVDAGEGRTYDIQANSPHTHAITVKAADFARIKKGEKLTITTSKGAEDNHTHVVFINLKPPAKKP